jgi:TnpA family transposase
VPVDFLTPEQKASYASFSGEPTMVELARYFHLDETDKDFIGKRRGERNRLGVGIQLGCVRFLGTFLSDLNQVPHCVQWFVARQISLADISPLESYSSRETTKREHAALIRNKYEYHDFDWPWTFRLSRILYTRSWISDERPGLLFEFATVWLTQNKVLLPGFSTLTRLISEVRERSSRRLWLRLSQAPSSAQTAKLESLLEVPSGSRTSRFDLLRKGPVNVSGPSLTKAIDRYLELKSYNLQSLSFQGVPPVRLKSLARHAGMISMHKIARMPKNRRIAILVAFVKAYEVSALDDALDLLDMLITEIVGNAKRLGQKRRLRTLKDLDRSALELARVCALVLDMGTEDDDLRSAIFGTIPRDRLKASIDIIHDLARPADDNFHDELVQQYGRVRRFLPKVLESIPFQATPSGKNIANTCMYLEDVLTSRRHLLDDAPIEIITNAWKRLVFDHQKRVLKQGYTLCFLDGLRDALRRRDVYVADSDRWGDPRAKLLQGHEWQVNQLQVCRSLGHPIQSSEAVSSLARKLDSTYKQVAANFSNNKAVGLDTSGDRPSLTITNLDKVEVNPSLQRLTHSVDILLPKVDLTELLLEIHEHTGFANEFSHVTESSARAEDIVVSICAVMIAEACNIGLEPLIKHQVPALTRHRLSWVKQNYFRAETLIRSNAKLVDLQSTLDLAKKWGGGEVASADGMRFVTPIRTVNSGPNRKYFGSNRGITWYNFMSDQFSGFHGIAIPGTLRDSIFVLEGLLEQQTGLNPREIMTDTSGSSDMIFGLFWLLGYQFSPRMADAGEAVFWRIDRQADYGALDSLARGIVDLNKIERHWNDMLRIAGSLKLGTIQASELLRSLLKSERPSSLAQAIIEAGRINKTLYLLNYVDDEDYRRRILTQLNRGESRHGLARAICHGQRGEIRKRYKEGQEDQLGALGLVTNAVVLWNTMYMQEALAEIQRNGQAIHEEDQSRLSPLGYKHINMLGQYSFSLKSGVKKGQLRPLRQTSQIDDVP